MMMGEGGISHSQRLPKTLLLNFEIKIIATKCFALTPALVSSPYKGPQASFISVLFNL